MNVRVFFFGATADAVGARSVNLHLPHGATASDALNAVMDASQKIAGHKLFFAVNQQHVTSDRRLNEGDEVAIFTAVSGG